MKFGSDVLLEIVDIVRDGIVSGNDISERLREIDVSPEEDILHLTKGYTRTPSQEEKN